MVDPTPSLPGLSPVQGKAVIARFDGGRAAGCGGDLRSRTNVVAAAREARRWDTNGRPGVENSFRNESRCLRWGCALHLPQPSLSDPVISGSYRGAARAAPARSANRKAGLSSATNFSCCSRAITSNIATLTSNSTLGRPLGLPLCPAWNGMAAIVSALFNNEKG